MDQFGRAPEDQLQQPLQVKLVGDLGADRAEGLELCRTRTDGLLSVLADGDVHHHPEQPGLLPTRCPHEASGFVHPDRVSVGGEHPVLARIRPALGHGPTMSGDGPLPVLGVQVGDPEIRLRQPLLGRVAQDRLGPFAGEEATERRGIGLPEDGIQALDQPSKAVSRRLSLQPEALALVPLSLDGLHEVLDLGLHPADDLGRETVHDHGQEDPQHRGG